MEPFPSPTAMLPILVVTWNTDFTAFTQQNTVLWVLHANKIIYQMRKLH